jgi:hypothetical protein
VYAPEAEQLRSLQSEHPEAADELICYACRALAECLQPLDRELQRLAWEWGDGRLPTAGPIRTWSIRAPSPTNAATIAEPSVDHCAI